MDKHPISKGQPTEHTVCWREHTPGSVCLLPEGHERYFTSLPDVDALRAHLDALNEAGAGTAVAGITDNQIPFLAALVGPYAEGVHEVATVYCADDARLFGQAREIIIGLLEQIRQADRLLDEAGT